MKNIFTKEDNLEIVNRINSLTASSERVWGKMDVTQMLVHCQKPLDVADNKLVIKRNIISLLFGKMMKKKLIDKEEPFKQNLPTAKDFVIVSTYDFDKEKATLSSLISRFGIEGEEIIKTKTHPFFGPMTPNEWGKLFYKHLDHHLRQFGG